MADFETSKTALLLTEPFFGSLLMKLPHAADDSVGTTAVSKTRLLYSPTWWATLTDDEGLFVLAHEVLHLVFDHLPHTESYVNTGLGPDGKKFNGDKWNIAIDYVVNDMLVKSRIGSMPAQGWISSEFTSAMLPAEIYCQMKDPPPCGGKGGGNGFDKHVADGTTAGQQQAITREDIMEAAGIAKATRGNVPGAVQRLLDILGKPPTNPWARLRKCVTSALSGHDQASWNRLHRRLVVRGIGAPGPVGVAQSGRIGIVCDTSGSIDQAMLNFFATHMAAIMGEAKPREAIIYWVDAALHDKCTVRNATQLRAYLAKGAKGGGGTDMTVGVRAAREDKCDICIVLTDGYTPFGDKHDHGPTMKLVWAITSPNITSPIGESIYIAGAGA